MKQITYIVNRSVLLLLLLLLLAVGRKLLNRDHSGVGKLQIHYVNRIRRAM